MHVLGLDISTSIVGVCIVDDSTGVLVPTLLDHIDLGKCNGFWEKVDTVTAYIDNLKSRQDFSNISNIAVEEALIGFTKGMSSAQTITTLIAFNAVIRHVLRLAYQIEPQCIPAATARKKAGVAVISKAKCGISVKDQVFAHMCKNDLSYKVWPLKKATKKNPNPSVKDFAKDITDAYVIAKASYLLNK